MKKSIFVIMTAALALFVSGCGFSTGGEDSTVSVINATPTPTAEPTATPVPTEAAATATPTPAATVTQTAGGVNIVKQDGTYTTTTDVVLREDASAESNWLANVTSGTILTSTGVSEDGGWIEVVVNGTTGYISAQYATAGAGTSTDTAAADTTAATDAAATTDTAAADTTAAQ